MVPLPHPEVMVLFSKKVAQAIRKVIPCNRVGMAVIGLEVPHAHIHLVPIRHTSDISFSGPRLKMNAGEMTAIAQAISAAFTLPE